MAESIQASPIHLHHPPCRGGQLSPCDTLLSQAHLLSQAQSQAMRNAGSGPMSASMRELFSAIHRDLVSCAVMQPWSTACYPGDCCDRGH